MVRKTLYIILVLAFAVITQGKAQALEVDSPISEKLSIYGYGAFHFCKTEKDGAFISENYLECSKGGSFAQFLFTPFFDFQITERLRAFLSMQIQYAPEIEVFGEIEAEEEEVEFETKGADEVEVEGFGEIDFQFVFIEYMFHQLATLRAGKYLTPFGLFLEGRDAPVKYPFLFLPKIYYDDGRFLPHYNVGIQLRGEMQYFKYILHIANGSGSVANVIDRNQDKAIGGTISFRIPGENFTGSLIGASIYRDKNFETEKEMTVFGGHILFNLLNVVPGKIQLIGEVFYKTENGTKSIGYYVVPNYTFSISKLAITPYIIYDFADYNLDDKGKGDVTHIGGGINFSPIPQLIIKTEILHESNNEKGDLKKQLIIGGGITYAF